MSETISIIVPSYNEEKSLPLFYDEICKIKPEFEKKDVKFVTDCNDCNEFITNDDALSDKINYYHRRRRNGMEQRIVQDVNIGANLKKLRRRASMTQAEVAAKLELRGLYVSREIYAQIEGGSHHIRVSVLLALKEIFHASYEEIFEIKTEL